MKKTIKKGFHLSNSLRKTLITSSCPFMENYPPKIKIGFWYKKFDVINSTTIQLGRICFWLTIKEWIKR